MGTSDKECKTFVSETKETVYCLYPMGGSSKISSGTSKTELISGQHTNFM